MNHLKKINGQKDPPDEARNWRRKQVLNGVAGLLDLDGRDSLYEIESMFSIVVDIDCQNLLNCAHVQLDRELLEIHSRLIPMQCLD